MTFGSTWKQAGLVWLGAAMMVGGAVAPGAAMPVAPTTVAPATDSGVEQAAYLRRIYRDRYGRIVRVPPRRVLSPNYYCRKQPSRCR